MTEKMLKHHWWLWRDLTCTICYVPAMYTSSQNKDLGTRVFVSRFYEYPLCIQCTQQRNLLAHFCWCFPISKIMILVLFLIVIQPFKANISFLRTMGSKTGLRGMNSAGEETQHASERTPCVFWDFQSGAVVGYHAASMGKGFQKFRRKILSYTLLRPLRSQ